MTDTDTIQFSNGSTISAHNLQAASEAVAGSTMAPVHLFHPDIVEMMYGPNGMRYMNNWTISHYTECTCNCPNCDGMKTEYISLDIPRWVFQTPITAYSAMPKYTMNRKKTAQQILDETEEEIEEDIEEE